MRSDHGMHTRSRTRTRGIDAPDQSVGDGTAQYHGIKHALGREVIDVLAAAAQEPQILEAFDRPADKHIALARLIHDVRPAGLP
jgi:hypothetical protein